MRRRWFCAIIQSGCFVALLAGVTLVNTARKGFSGASPSCHPTDEKVEKLLSTLRDKRLRESDPTRLVEAIQQLGRMKAAAAIADLVDLLTFRRTWPWETPGGPIDEIHTITPAGRYPAVGALMEIGKPSVPAVTKVIEEKASDSLEVANALEVVRFIFRERPPAAVEYLQGAAAKAASTETAERLRKAAEKLK